MSSGPSNAGANAPDDFPTEEEFKEALKDPAFVAHLNEHYRKVLNGEFGELTPELRELARVALDKNVLVEKLAAVQTKFEEFQALTKRPAGTMRAEERLAEAKRIFDELTDAGLELPEPHRTELLKGVVKLRAEIHAMRVEG
jgi:hypothetical protein